MHSETQPKTKHLMTRHVKILPILSLLTLSACSFVELTPGAERIIFSNHSESCKKIQDFHAVVKTSTLFIDRNPKAISDELQVLAQNEAFRKYGNAIWPTSEIKKGHQSFDISFCGQN